MLWNSSLIRIEMLKFQRLFQHVDWFVHILVFRVHCMLSFAVWVLKKSRLCSAVTGNHTLRVTLYCNSLVWVSEVAQSCPTLCDSVDCSPPGSSVHGILQARVQEWVAIPFSRGSWPRDQPAVSRIAGRLFTSWATREAQYGSSVWRMLKGRSQDDFRG